MTYDYHTELTSPNQSGRRTSKITSITIHWWGDPKHYGDAPNDGDAKRVAQYLCRKGGTSSANYVVTANEVWCIVDPDNIAWHAGNFQVNKVSIGIECDADTQAGAYQTVAELIAELRKEYGNLPLYPHRKWQATQCPGSWDLAKLDRMAREIAGGKLVSNPVKPAKPPKKINIKPIQGAIRTWKDNIWGPDTEKRSTAVREASIYFGNRFPYGVAFAQSCVGTPADGVWGPKSRRAHDQTTKAIQRALKKLGLYKGKVDGIYGPLTHSAMKAARTKSKS